MSNGWDGADPTQVDDGPTVSYELGVAVTVNDDITITGVRVWHGANTATVVGRSARLWTTGGSELDAVDLDDALAPGWTTYELEAPLERTAGQQFVLSYSTRQYYGATAGGFPNASADNAVTFTGGVFRDGGPGLFPSTPSSSFFGIDLVYTLGIGGNVAPVVTLAVTMAGLVATALASVVDEAPGSVGYRFVWGDGETTVSGSPTASHTYAAPGTYAVLVVATDAGGLTGSAAVPVLARRAGPGGLRLSEIAAEVAVRLDTIDGLTAHAYQPGSIIPPAAIVLNPRDGDIQYDQTYGRGMDRLTLPVLLVVGRAQERPAQAAVREFCDGAGARSVKAVLEAGEYASCDVLVVTTGGVDGVKIGGTEYLAALFDLDIAGQGGSP